MSHDSQPRPMRVRQVAVITDDLDADTEALCNSLGLEVAHKDPEMADLGLDHVVIPIGDTFFEIITPVRNDVTGARFLDKHGRGGYMVIVQVEDLAAYREHLPKLGVRIVADADRGDWASLHLHPKDVGAALLSIDIAEPPESFSPSGPRWQECVRTHIVRDMVGVELRSPEPAALAERWGKILGREPNGLEIPLDHGVIRIVASNADEEAAFCGVDLVATDRSQAGSDLALCGLTVHLV